MLHNEVSSNLSVNDFFIGQLIFLENLINRPARCVKIESYGNDENGVFTGKTIFEK